MNHLAIRSIIVIIYGCHQLSENNITCFHGDISVLICYFLKWEFHFSFWDRKRWGAVLHCSSYISYCRIVTILLVIHYQMLSLTASRSQVPGFDSRPWSRLFWEVSHNSHSFVILGLFTKLVNGRQCAVVMPLCLHLH